MGVGTGAGMGARIERMVERTESPGTYEVVIEVGRKTRQRGGRQRATSSHSLKTRCPGETATLYGGPELREGKRRTGSGRPEKGEGVQETAEEL